MIFRLVLFRVVGFPIGFRIGFFWCLVFRLFFFQAVGFPVGFRIGILVVYRDSKSYSLYGAAKIIRLHSLVPPWVNRVAWCSGVSPLPGSGACTRGPLARDLVWRLHPWPRTMRS